MSRSKLITCIVLSMLSSLALALGNETSPPALPNTAQTASEQQSVSEPPKTRGQLLYENHCVACHQSSLHIRDRRKARNIAEINQWVTRWVNYQTLNWTVKDIQQVANYLNRQFYHYQE